MGDCIMKHSANQEQMHQPLHQHYSVPGAFAGICQIYHGSSAGIILFQSWTYQQFIFVLVSVFGVFCRISDSHVATVFTYGGSNVGVCNTATLQSLPWQAICASWWWSVAHTRSALSGCSSHCFEYREPHSTNWDGSKPFQQYGGAYSFGAFTESLDPSASPTWWGGIFFSR